MRLCNTGDLGSFNNYRVNRCDKDVSLSHRLSPIPRLVRYASLQISLSSLLTMLDIASTSSANGSESFRRPNHFALNSSSAFKMSTNSDRLEVAVHTTYDQSPESPRDQPESISPVSMDRQLRDQPPHEPHFQDAESGL